MAREKLTRNEYLTALGLWHLATKHQRLAEEYETALNSLLGCENGSHVSDSIYTTGDNLERALESMGIKFKEVK